MSLREDTLNKLREHIKSFSGFSEDDKEVWMKRIEILPPEYALFLLEILEEAPEEVMRVHENIKEKEKILGNKDETAWKKLLEKERKHLDFLTKKE